jgi:hypothetical protein
VLSLYYEEIRKRANAAREELRWSTEFAQSSEDKDKQLLKIDLIFEEIDKLVLLITEIR